MPSVAKKWKALALLKKALSSDTFAHVPEMRVESSTDDLYDLRADMRIEARQVRHLADLLLRWVTNESRDDMLAFNQACEIIGADPREIRQALRI